MSGHCQTVSAKLGKWCAYALLLVTPGSFIVLAALCLVRVWMARRRPGGRPALGGDGWESLGFDRDVAAMLARIKGLGMIKSPG